MPVMKQLRIGSATYDTVGEASVTQTLTSGTEIATVTIDGTATKLYAPDGGGGGGMVITVTMTNSGSSIVYTLDKTVGEITSALSEGVSPLFSYIDGTGLRYYVMETALFTSSNSRLYIKSNGWTMNFSASGVDAYPSFTQSGGSND